MKLSGVQHYRRGDGFASGVLRVESAVCVPGGPEVLMRIEVRQPVEGTAGLSDRECRQLLRDAVLRYLDPA